MRSGSWRSASVAPGCAARASSSAWATGSGGDALPPIGGSGKVFLDQWVRGRVGSEFRREIPGFSGNLPYHGENSPSGAPQRVRERPGRRAAAVGEVRHRRVRARLHHAGLRHPALDGADRPAGDRGRTAPPFGRPAADSHRDAGAHVSGDAGDRVGPPPRTGVRAILRLGADLRLPPRTTRLHMASAFAPARPVCGDPLAQGTATGRDRLPSRPVSALSVAAASKPASKSAAKGTKIGSADV